MKYHQKNRFILQIIRIIYEGKTNIKIIFRQWYFNKQRFSYLDLQVICNELQFLTTYRLQNIYDLRTSSRQFALKFAVPNSKKLIVIDPGFRLHLTEYARATASTPSGFVAKLRKHLKTRRLRTLRVAPATRVLVFTFSDDNSYHLVVEFYAGGNLILLDKEHKILSLQRIVPASENQTRCAVGEIYPLEEVFSQHPYSNEVSEDLLRLWLDVKSSESLQNETTLDSDNRNSISNPLGERIQKKSAKEKTPSLKKLLYTMLPGISAGLIENALLKYNIDGNLPYTNSEYMTRISDIACALKDAKSESNQLVASHDSVPGYILAKKNPNYIPRGDSAANESAVVPDRAIDPSDIEYLFEDFQPFRIRLPNDEQFKLIEYGSFNQAVDSYYSTSEATKLSLRLANQEQVAERRLNAAKTEKEKRVEGLTQVQEKSHLLGLALETYADRVEEVADAVRGLVQQGMDWQDIEKLIAVEQSRQNTVAQMVKLPLNLVKNKMTVILPDPHYDIDNSNSESDDESLSGSEIESDDDGSETEDKEQDDSSQTKANRSNSSPNQLKVEIDLGLSAWANSRKYYDVKKIAAAKQERTVHQAEHAYKSAEKKIHRDLKLNLAKEKLEQSMLHAIREPFWFEKFAWFLSTDGYLVLGGRDSSQNDLLLARYFKANDLYVHCDVDGASVVIIKNYLSTPEIPPSTLTQAGMLSVCTSKAWDSKMLTSAWWAQRDQIPKLTSEGDIVTSNRIIVNGSGKHYLPPTPLDMGLGFLWMVSDEALERYPNRYNDEPKVEQDNDSKDTSESEEEFPDTALDSDEDFPDTQFDSSEEFNDSEAEDNMDDKSQAEEKDNLVEQITGNVQVDEHKENCQEDQTVTQEDIQSLNLPSRNHNNQPKFGKRLTAKQRREMRKQNSQVPTVSSSEEELKEHSSALDIEQTLDSLKLKSSKKDVSGEQKRPTVRGKKGKLKKIATKYANQDEEDRKVRMEILGTTKGLEKQAQREKEYKQRKEELDRNRKERQKRAKETEMKRLLSDDTEDNSSQEWTSIMKNLVPKLHVGDKPIGIVPVFGPWQALQKFKFKIKFQPGTVKKGKAIKDILRSIVNAKSDSTETDPDYMWPSELSLIRSLKEPELILLVSVGRVKVSIPGQQGQNQKKVNNVKGAKKKGKH